MGLSGDGASVHVDCDPVAAPTDSFAQEARRLTHGGLFAFATTHEQGWGLFNTLKLLHVDRVGAANYLGKRLSVCPGRAAATATLDCMARCGPDGRAAVGWRANGDRANGCRCATCRRAGKGALLEGALPPPHSAPLPRK